MREIIDNLCDPLIGTPNSRNRFVPFPGPDRFCPRVECCKDIISGFPVQLAEEDGEFIINELSRPFCLRFPVAHGLLVNDTQVVYGKEPHTVNILCARLYIPGLGNVDQDERAGMPLNRPAPFLHGFF